MTDLWLVHRHWSHVRVCIRVHPLVTLDVVKSGGRENLGHPQEKELLPYDP